MYKTLLIARQEFLVNVRKRSFLAAAFGVPLLTVVMTLIVVAVTANTEGDLSRFPVVGGVDEANVITGWDDPTASYAEPPVPMFMRYDSEEAAKAAFDAKQIGAYFVIPADYMATGSVRLVSSGGTPKALTDKINELLQRSVGRNLDAALLERIMEPANPQLHFLSTGRTVPIEAAVGLLLTPILFVTIFMVAAQTTSGYLMSGVVEEKSNRIMEILITTVTPTQLLGGKIIGLGGLGLMQLVIWGALAGVAALVAQATGSALLSAIYISPDMALAGLVFFILGYFFLATVMASIGAIVGSEQESRQYAGIFSLLLAIPFFALVTFITEPNGPVPTLLSLIPLTAPTAMVMRMTFITVPPEQMLLSIALLIVMNVFILWGAARVFRFALLMYGKKLRLRDVVGLLRRRGAAGAMVTRAGERT